MSGLIDRDKFFAAVRADPFGGVLLQPQVDGLNTLLDVWETHFRDGGIRWLPRPSTKRRKRWNTIPNMAKAAAILTASHAAPMSGLLRQRLRPVDLGG
jgi:hypothetical protein